MTDCYLIEYIWLDVYDQLRSKTKVHPRSAEGFESLDAVLAIVPSWTYDGSSTGQAEGSDSDVILKPCAICYDPFRQSDEHQRCYLIMCETFNKDGSPHKTNYRRQCAMVMDDEKVKQMQPWFGIEQEYVIYDRKTHMPYKWESYSDPGCGVQG